MMRIKRFGSAAILVTTATLAAALLSGVSPAHRVASPVAPVVFGAPLPLDPRTIPPRRRAPRCPPPIRWPDC